MKAKAKEKQIIQNNNEITKVGTKQSWSYYNKTNYKDNEDTAITRITTTNQQ